MIEGLCLSCHAEAERKAEEARRRLALRLRLIALGGGEKPYREFRFETYQVTPDNQSAFVRAKNFNPNRDNLYLWGPCGVGKTHLAFAIVRRSCEAGYTVEFLKPPQLMRKVRRKDPDEEQHAIDRFVRADVFALDDLGIGQETAYARQIFQEILDGRHYAYRAGLVVTSKFSPGDLARKLDDDTTVSRLAGMCQVVEVRGKDHRLTAQLTAADPARDKGV